MLKLIIFLLKSKSAKYSQGGASKRRRRDLSHLADFDWIEAEIATNIDQKPGLSLSKLPNHIGVKYFLVICVGKL